MRTHCEICSLRMAVRNLLCGSRQCGVTSLSGTSDAQVSLLFSLPVCVGMRFTPVCLLLQQQTALQTTFSSLPSSSDRLREPTTLDTLGVCCLKFREGSMV